MKHLHNNILNLRTLQRKLSSTGVFVRNFYSGWTVTLATVSSEGVKSLGLWMVKAKIQNIIISNQDRSLSGSVPITDYNQPSMEIFTLCSN